MKVYWIRRKGYTDITKEGYVGITDHWFQRRFKHKNHLTKNKKLQGHIKKYDDIVYEVVYEGTKEECIKLEKDYRPTKYIGWNQLAGGGLPPLNKGKKWFNNGVNSTLAFECPEGYKPGRIIVSGEKHGHYGKKKKYKTTGFEKGRTPWNKGLRKDGYETRKDMG